MRNLNVLVVDDSTVNRLIVSRLISALGHTVMTAEDGQQALACCEQTRPDLILMDVIMPRMDGLEATRRIRARFENQWIPIIFLTGKIEQEDMLAGLEAGGDDYLTKPVDIKLLTAKIRVMSRIADMQHRISLDAQRLEAYYHANEMEQQLAEHVLHNLYGDRSQTGIEQWILPAVQFSGDIITAARSPTDTLHIMLADSTGHGLSAAISCLPAATVFYAMTQKGFGINAIAREINKKLKQHLPVGRFVAATLAAINPQEKTVTVWNGGIPFAAFVGEDGRIEKQFHSSNPPLGILRNADFDASVEVYRWTDPGRLMICSDGLTEARSVQNEILPPEQLAAQLNQRHDQAVLAQLRERVMAHLAGTENADDISLVLVPCAGSFGNPQPHAANPSFTQLSNWQLQLDFGPKELREELGMATLLGWLNQIGLSENQLSEMLLIVTELYNNALDHGVLGLDSSQKHSSSGFASYLLQRAGRLFNLQQGWIHVAMSHVTEDERPLLRLTIRDSGSGFDHVYYQQHEPDELAMHGRGIALVRRLCHSMRYLDHGSCVEVEYILR
ncbi:MAG: SpoIIE family protein phosphatase [Vogesella sp.]|uniref:SpoIIE family protein phosphatase n=1 Tax=Vogesella sp. TaxID=1904252 RepID=UPI00391DB1CA